MILLTIISDPDLICFVDSDPEPDPGRKNEQKKKKNIYFYLFFKWNFWSSWTTPGSGFTKGPDPEKCFICDICLPTLFNLYKFRMSHLRAACFTSVTGRTHVLHTTLVSCMLAPFTARSTCSQCCGAESQGAEIKLPPGGGAGVEITNCGSGSSSGSFESFLFIQDVKKFYRKKSWLLKKFL